MELYEKAGNAQLAREIDAALPIDCLLYTSYLRGECYGFELYKNGELSDSCWGFMGNFSDVLKDMAAYLPEMCIRDRYIV